VVEQTGDSSNNNSQEHAHTARAPATRALSGRRPPPPRRRAAHGRRRSRRGRRRRCGAGRRPGRPSGPAAAAGAASGGRCRTASSRTPGASGTSRQLPPGARSRRSARRSRPGGRAVSEGATSSQEGGSAQWHEPTPIAPEALQQSLPTDQTAHRSTHQTAPDSIKQPTMYVSAAPPCALTVVSVPSTGSANASMTRSVLFASFPEPRR
jgi:hypothetical protein